MCAGVIRRPTRTHHILLVVRRPRYPTSSTFTTYRGHIQELRLGQDTSETRICAVVPAILAFLLKTTRATVGGRAVEVQESRMSVQRDASATDHIVAWALGELAVAVNPPAVEAGRGRASSVLSDVMCPDRDPSESRRTTCPAGAVHELVADERSLQ